MSNRQVRDAKLDLSGVTWVGPLFTPEVRALQARLAAYGGSVDVETLELATRIPGAVSSHQSSGVRTSDGYEWYWCRRFIVPEFKPQGCVALLLPHCNDVAREDGTVTDRSVAAYYLGTIAICDVDGVVRWFKLNLPEPDPHRAH